MKLATVTKTAAAIALTSIAVAGSPAASAAYPITGKLGSELKLTDSVGQVTYSWTVSNLKPSSDVMPGYPVAGRLWEATATVKALGGPVTPAISQFNAVAPDAAA